MIDGLNFIAIDFETANYEKTSAISVGLIRFENGVETDSVYSLIKPPTDNFVAEFTRDIHHICYDDVKNEADFKKVWACKVEPFIKQTADFPLVAHNAGFDMTVIKRCTALYGMKLPSIKYFDSLRVAQKTWPELKCHKLTFLGEHFDVEYKAHDALEDSRTCGIVVNKACQTLQVDSVEKLLKTLKLPLKSL